jgi:membrane protein
MASENDRGRGASRPRELGRRGWKDVAWRVRGEMKNDNAGLIAAGVAFYGFFALFPTLFAVVALYGLVANPADVGAQISSMGTALPANMQTLIEDQLSRLASGSRTALGWGLVVSLLIAFWSASKGVRGLMEALNVAYDETEHRGFVKRTAITLLLTIGGIVTAIVAIALVVAVPFVLNMVGLGAVARIGAQVVRWILLIGVVLFGLAVVYRIGPSRDSPKWRWVTPGSIVAAVLWIIASIGFSIYANFFSSYQKTFGSLAGVAVVLMWFYISALVVIVGAEINAESEHQTRRDTTRGRDEAMGKRGARMADTLGEPHGPEPAT